jgi:hypothetical protein
MANRKKPSPAKKKTAAKAKATASAMPDIIYAQASPRSVGGVSMFEAQHQIDSETVANFASEESRNSIAVDMLLRAGFDVLQVSAFSINIAGPREVYERAFGASLVVRDLPTMKSLGEDDVAQYIDDPRTELLGLIRTEQTAFEEILEGVAIEVPRYFMAPSMFPPAKAYWHLHPPGDIAVALNAERVHRGGITGRRNPRGHGRQRLVQASVLRRARLPGRHSGRRAGSERSADRSGPPRNGRVGEHLLRRSRRAVPAGQDELRQHSGRVQRRRRAQPAHHHVQLGQ